MNSGFHKNTFNRLIKNSLQEIYTSINHNSYFKIRQRIYTYKAGVIDKAWYAPGINPIR